MLFLETWQALGGIEAGRTTTVVIVTCVAVLIAAGCRPEQPPGKPVVVVAAGDIATCSGTGDEATAKLVGGIDGTVLTLGDEAYPDGTAEDFEECYEPSWGRFKWRTKPTPGNHEYYTQGAEGYFDYFGKAAGDPDKGYYSFNLGSWHIVALNSNCGEEEIHCGPGSAQRHWLEEDLAANKDKRCTLAYMHHPRFSSGEEHGSTPKLEPLWGALYEAGADVVLSGHEHNYERFAPQDPEEKRTPRGASGSSWWAPVAGATTPSWIPFPNSEVHNDETYGVLKLTLNPEGYQWRFVPAAGGEFTDSGEDQCH